MIRHISLVLALGILTSGCQKSCAPGGATEQVILRAPSFDHPLLVQQRELIEHNRETLDNLGIQVYVDIVNPNMFALREMPDNSFQVYLFDKNGAQKACYKGHVVPLGVLTSSGEKNTPQK